MTRRVDILVVGCGPAGVLTAILLARRGFEVAMLRSMRAALRIEGLGARVVEILGAHGLEKTVAAVGPQVRRTAAWSGETSRRNREFVTRRDLLDAALIEDAEAAGIAVLTAKRHAIERDGPGIVARVAGAEGGDRRIDARFLVEARGRAAPRARRGSRRGPETVALVRAMPPAAAAATAVESFDEGWAWYVATGERAILQIFVDSREGLPSRKAIAAYFDRLHARLPLIRDASKAAAAEGPVMTRNATALLSGALIGARDLRVGDAALGLDPLSGHGVFEALGSALAASAVIATLLARPERRDLAARFYNDRAVLGFERNARVGRDFYRLEDRWPDRAFWRARRDWPDDLPAHAAPGSAPAEVARRPVVDDGLISERRVIVTPDQPRGVWRLDGVPLADLLDALRGTEFGDSSWDGAGLAAQFAAKPEQIRGAVAWLRQTGLLS